MNLESDSKKDDKCRILLFEQYTIVREGLTAILENGCASNAVEATGDANEIVSIGKRFNPHLILLAISNDNTSAINIIPKVLETNAQAKILLLTDEKEITVQQLAVRFGAAGVVHREQNCDTLLKAVSHICDGGVWLNHKLMRQVLIADNDGDGKIVSEAQQKINSLTERELQVASLASRGLKNKEIAKSLFISEATVRHHLTSIFGKLEVNDRVSLLIFSFKNQLVAPESMEN